MNEIIEIENFPLNLKKGVQMVLSFEFDCFSGVEFGKGYHSYRGDWFEITDTDVKWHHFDPEDTIVETVPHHLHIDRYLSCVIDVDDESVAHLAINTYGGVFMHAFQWNYEMNGKPFMLSQDTVRKLVFKACSKEFEKPVWMFGDSYFGVVSCRIIGQLKNYGYMNFLVDGLAGQGSPGAFAELERALLYGTPKLLVWCLGMNDSDESYCSVAEKVIAICKERGIELVLSKIPTVPQRSKEKLNAYIEQSGFRYIDSYQAVGASPEGRWYDGYLYEDKVHPTDAGAQALAMRYLIDVPELMR
ncbi:MAG: SGNH/GDSL hydrolase family protein [Eubacteriales bacterium]